LRFFWLLMLAMAGDLRDSFVDRSPAVGHRTRCGTAVKP
jgi:hypothetical protein